MGKRANKRQKVALEAANERPVLGVVDPHADQAGKDDEERRLESLLFGTPYVPSGKGKEKERDDLIVVSDAEDAEDGGAGGELENMLDSEVGTLLYGLF
jgi:U3 small nucleolar RNA-associated protein 18